MAFWILERNKQVSPVLHLKSEKAKDITRTGVEVETAVYVIRTNTEEAGGKSTLFLSVNKLFSESNSYDFGDF